MSITISKSIKRVIIRMSGLLCLDKDMQLELNGIKDNKPLLCNCQDIIKYKNQYNFNSARYILSSTNSTDTYILDVQKTYTKDIQLTCYKLLEEMEFDLNFLSLVGTSPLGYHRPDMKNVDYVLYDIINNYTSNIDNIKYIVTEDELPKNPHDKGYTQDGNGNWYFIADKTKGNLLKFQNDYKLSWEYKQDDSERLLIEIEAYKGMQDYIKNTPSISIYDGKLLNRKDIRILEDEKVLEFS